MAKDRKPEKKHNPSNKWTFYEISGDKLTRKKRSCPKCGAGVFLAEHKDRASCGKCGYTEFARGGVKGGEPAVKPAGEVNQGDAGKPEDKKPKQDKKQAKE